MRNNKVDIIRITGEKIKNRKMDAVINDGIISYSFGLNRPNLYNTNKTRKNKIILLITMVNIFI